MSSETSPAPLDYSYLRSMLGSSVDDLKSSLRCTYSEPNAKSLAVTRALLEICPDNLKSKRETVARHLRMLERAGIAAGEPINLTCQDCGASFVRPGDLVTHECQEKPEGRVEADYVEPADLVVQAEALELMPKTSTLEDVEAQIREIQFTFGEKTRAFHNEVIYDVVAIGVFALKGREIHLAQAIAQASNLKRGASRPGDATVASPGEAGFFAWIARMFPSTSRRSVQNYMNAARNAGLTSDSTLADVEALRAGQVLHDKKPTDLYRLAAPLQNPAPASTQSKPGNLVSQVQADFFANFDQILTIKEDMEPDVYEATCTRISASLEKFTGHRWVMVEEAPGADDEHGSMSFISKL